MSTEFRLPDLGEGLTEAEIVQWLVAPGDAVVLNQTLAEVETAKAIVELPSPYDGTVTALHAEAGDTVAVGAPLIAFAVAGDAPDDPVDGRAEGVRTQESQPAADAAPAAQANLVGYGAAPAAGRPARRARRAATASSADTAVLEAAPHDAVAATPMDPVTGDRPRSTPPVRAYAKRRGVDLVLLATEIGERVITRADVDAYAERVDPVAPAVNERRSERVLVETPERETRIPIRGVRKHTADAMVASAFTAPHVTCFHTVDATATMQLIASLREDRMLAEHRIGPLAVIAKAVCLALARTPGLNARWDEDAVEIVQHHFVDLGIAAATDRGLIVPHIREAQGLSLIGIADALRELTDVARAGKTSPADLAGGTFSITNIGVFGIEGGTPILPPGQSGILAVGAIRPQPWVHEGELAVRQVMTLSLSFDHRIVDGAEGARFLKDVGDLIEEPGRAMLMA
ncbi:dihydrolipoamide acetyltransferase family protein [Microbacterium sp. NPDC055903]